ncbi:threonine ammonia-lyase [Fontivita pretiosa]|uniref:threonine ammonia-lyase n=1 Tax=Fontivita pretiosa TaxID=2989684 RepID=UPI003D17F99A
MSVTLQDIQAAQQRISDKVFHTPCPYSLALSRLCGCQVWCKLDNVQVTGSFKERGARNKLLLLSQEQKRCGVIAASAGNHALGLAYHGQLLGIPVTVVMPKWAPFIKVTNCRSFGATVILHGQTFDEARSHAMQLRDQHQLVYVHGFDDPDIIAGQGTMGLEILQDVPDVQAVIVPVGGGGLIAGVGTAIKSLRPQVLIIGAESVAAPTLHASLQAGRVVRIESKPTLADGLAIAEVGRLCFEIARRVVDDVVLVDEPQIATSILRLLELEKTVVEGAGAVPLAAALRRREQLAGKRVVLCLAGGNIDVSTLGHVIERGLAADGRLCRVIARISDRPGGLAHLASVIAETGASIKEIIHDRSFGPADVASVRVWCILETRDFEHIRQVHEALARAGIDAEPG